MRQNYVFFIIIADLRTVYKEQSVISATESIFQNRIVRKSRFGDMMFSWFFEIAVLVTALSVDTFAAGFTYGICRIKVPPFSFFVITLLSCLTLGASLAAGRLAGEILPPGAGGRLGVLLLIVLGVWKLFSGRPEEGAEKADKNSDKIVSWSEALTLGLALSADSLAAGVGAGALKLPILAACAASFFTGAAALWLGGQLGRLLSVRIHVNVCRLSGLLLLGLALLKLAAG